ncbi:MAG: alpha/beta-hydrolase family protein [Pseudoclavibacter sp.]
MASRRWKLPFPRSVRRGKRAMRVSVGVDIATKPFGWIDRWGLVVSQLFGWAALGPSLIPRRWWMTTLTLGLSQISGYAAGRSLHLGLRACWFVLRGLGFRRSTKATRRASPSRRTAERLVGDGGPLAHTATILRALNTSSARDVGAALLGVVVGAGTIASLRASVERQTEIAGLVRARMPATREQLAGMAGGMAVAAAALGVEWIRIAATHGLRRRLRTVTPGAVAISIGAAVPAAALALLGDRAFRRIWKRLVAAATADNELDIPGVSRPATPLRSGSPRTPIAWKTLGRHGRAFTGSGQSAAGIAAAMGAPAMEPIRAFASVLNWRTMTGAARAAASELRRTGAYDRDVLVIATTTGTGWLNDWAVGAVEHLTRGNCATVGMQYTVLTSALAAMGQPRAPINAARALLAAVERDLAARPSERRPRVYVTGESLGALGILGSVDSIDELLTRTDGGVLAGSPRISKHWDALVAGRDAGSTEVHPVIDGGRRIRFATQPSDLDLAPDGTPFGPWEAPRLAALQHASDPVVWWSPGLLVRRPDWMRERAGRDVTDHIGWMPVVTFWQIATDMPAAVTTPGGYAHRYFEEYVTAWNAVLGTNADETTLARVTQSIRRSLPLR